MKAVVFILLLLTLQLSINAQQPKYQASWQSLDSYTVPDWFRDAKFGIFIHWGVYSVPAFGSEWYPRHMYEKDSKEYKHHVETYGTQDKFGYKDFIPMFKAEKFDATKWAELFKNAGAKYVVPVAEHHDGFAMYNTALSKWNAVNMGPKRDIVGEIAEAVKKQGLILGVSSHRIEHWWFMNGGRAFNSDVNDTAYADFYGPATVEDAWDTTGKKPPVSIEYMNDWLMRDIELVEKYKPQLFWFDWWIEQKEMEPYRKSFAAYYYNKGLEWNKGVVLNYKNEAYPGNTAVLDLERGKLGGIREPAWQTDDAIGNNSWGYAQGNTFKSVQYVVTNLIDIVSKNGNLLLNIGPRPDGTITDEEAKVLLGTGKWLSVNGDAIYGTRPWKIFGEGPTESASGSFKDQKIPFTANDIRFTTKGNTLYAITLNMPVAATSIKALSRKGGNGKVAVVKLLGSAATLKWKQTDDALVIEPLKSYPVSYAPVAYEITFTE